MGKTHRFRGCLLGLACGDAVGAAVEFRARGSFSPVGDMVGGGPFNLRPGEWTDDTSMALCLATSLVEKQGFDPDDQMQRYCAWQVDGYLSSNGRCFDIGNTVRAALDRYRRTGDPLSGSTDERSAGNGSIMRLASVPMFYHRDHALAIHYSEQSSRTTHGTQECLCACRLLGSMIFRALAGETKDDILFRPLELGLLPPKVEAIAAGGYREKNEDSIRGSGYVVDSLEAALWCFLSTDSFREAILRATNLGNDADTTAAVCGQIAGAYYGEAGIPTEWLERLVMSDQIRELAGRLYVLGESV